MKKLVLIFGFVFAAVGATLTIIVMATLTSESFPFSFDFGMTVIAPSIAVSRFLGFQEGTSTNPWLAGTLVTLLNTAMCFSAGALVGFVVYHLTRAYSIRNEIAG